jgi:hypothetical protein
MGALCSVRRAPLSLPQFPQNWPEMPLSPSLSLSLSLNANQWQVCQQHKMCVDQPSQMVQYNDVFEVAERPALRSSM